MTDEYYFDEVNAVDKYEYKLKTDEMLELMEKGAYREAAEIADSIDWNRVRNASMLTNVSDIYEKIKDYHKSYSVLNLAYRRAEGSRKIISRLCSLALKTGNIEEAIDYYDDFMQLAPKDPNQYILKYQILRAQRAPIEQQIEALEEYKKSEYIEEWAYELAKLYQEAGMTAECLEECDDLILWFSEGKYVYKAMELKMQYKSLTPSQQQKYDKRNAKPAEETEEMPDVSSYYGDQQESEGETEQEPAEVIMNGEIISEGEDIESPDSEKTEETQESTEEAEPVQGEEKPKKKIGDTMPLGEALRKLLHPESEEQNQESEEDNNEPNSSDDEDSETQEEGQTEEISETDEELEIDAEDAEAFEEEDEEYPPLDEEEPLDDLEQAIDEIEAVVDMEIPEFPIRKRGRRAFSTGEMTEILPSEEEETEDTEEAAEIEETVEENPKKEADQITGQMSLEDILSDWEDKPDDKKADEESAEGDITGDIMDDNTKKKGEPILPPDIQRMIDEIEGVIPPQEEVKKEKTTREKNEELFRTNRAKVADELRMNENAFEEEDEFEEDDLLSEAEDYKDELLSDEGEAYYEEDELPEEEEYYEEDELPEEEEYYEEELPEEEEYYEEEELPEEEEYYEEEELPEEEEYYEEEELPEEEEYYEEDAYDLYDDDDDDEENYREGLFDKVDAPDLEEEFRVNPEHSAHQDDREIPDDDDDGIDIMSATTPLSRKETAKMIATGKTAPLPLDEISDALSMSDTGFIVHGRYDLEMQSGIGTRAGLTEEQKKLFSYFVPVRGMSEQLVDVLEQDKNCTNRKGTSRTGNLLIIGNKGNGKTVLAVDVVKAIQKQRDIRQGKVAIVTGESLNKKKIGDIVQKLYGGALIIEKASKMNEKTVARLNKAMEKDTGEMLIVLEEQRKPLDRLLSSNREFRRKFTSRLEVPIFINDELVTFGQTYAQENGYRIDEMGILALYSKIDSLQREDHAVTVAEVKEIMDEAIQHSQKASAKKLMKRVFGKNTDDSDRILLSEKDFNI